MVGQVFLTAEERRTLQFAYLWAFAAVLGDDFSLTMQPDIGQAPYFAHSPLARDVIASLQAELEKVKKKFRQDRRTAQQGLGEVADLLDRKVAAGQAREFKLTVVAMTESVVEVIKKLLAQEPNELLRTADGRQFLESQEKQLAGAGAALVRVAISLRLGL